jgi:ribosomal protein S18 acetylase RimI-like enzyme
MPPLQSPGVPDVAAAQEATPELIDAFARLIPQLSRSSPPPGQAELQAMIDAPGTSVLVATNDDDAITGTLTLVVFRIPTGMRAWIEDVVVDEAARGQGVGEALTLHALDVARAAGAKTVDLTSRPSREAANRLYQRLGFTARETNVYRFECS